MSQAHLLLELLSHPNHTPTTLAPILSLDRSTVSRLLGRLEDEKLVQITSSPKDRRSKWATITAAGKRALAAWERKLFRSTEKFIEPLNVRERKTLQRFLKQLADGLGAAPVSSRHGHPFRIEMHRVSRSAGFLGKWFMDTGLSVTQCHVMQLASCESNTITTRELLELIPLEDATVSRAISFLEKQGYLYRAPAPSDRRSYLVKTTTKGNARFAEVRSLGASTLRTALPKIQKRVLKEAVSLLGRCGSDAEATSISREEHLLVRRLSTKGELTNARAYYLENMVRMGKHTELPPGILDFDGRSFGLFLDKELEGVCEFQRHGSAWRLMNFYVSGDLESAEGDEFFVRGALSQLASEFHVTSVTVNRKILPSKLMQKMGEPANGKRERRIRIPRKLPR